MARSPTTTAAPPIRSRRRRATFSSSLTLAVWRIRQLWRLLLVAGLGNIAAVLLICIVPLFTQVALSAGLRGVLTDQSNGAQITITAFSTQATQDMVTAIQQRLDQIVTTDAGRYVTGKGSFSITLQNLMIPAGNQSTSSTDTAIIGQMQVYGRDLTHDTSQYKLSEGRLPLASSSVLEIALPQADATSLHAQLGTVLQVQQPGPQQPASIDVHVVGILAGSLASLTNQQFGGGPSPVFSGPGGPHFYTALASSDAILKMLSGNTAAAQAFQSGPPPQLSWAYPLDVSHINTGDLNDLLDRLGKVQTDVPGRLNGSNNVQDIFLDSRIYNALTNFRIQIIVLQIPLLLLLLQVMALVLLFVRMMAEMLVDRQADAIANLRSRGATRRQIFNAFTLHNMGLSVLSLIVGPLAAIPLVRFLSLQSLPPESQAAVDSISGNPLAVAWGLRWYVLVAVVAAGFAMIFSTNRAAGKNILTLRQESARATNKPFWQRLNLDLIFGGLSLLGYAGYSIAVRQLEPRIQLILSPLSLIAALVMLVAAALFFLRLLPILLGLGARLSTRGRSASTMLAFTQMARAPKQPIRMTLLLAISTGFTIFTLIYSASQAQRLVDVAAFQTGADFAGTIPASVAKGTTAADLTARYAHIAGVTSASLGYSTIIDPRSVPSGIPVQLFAVDANTYARSATWTSQDSSQPLGDLMTQLAAARTTAAAQDSVPAILDSATWQQFHLTPGAQFTLQPPGYDTQSMRFTAIARVQYIPTVYDSVQGGGFSGAGGILVDYQTYADIYKHDLSTSAPPVNTAWIASASDASALANVRKALHSGDLALDSLQDQRQVLANERSNPLQIDLANTLLIGAMIALLLALIGIWVGSWLNARSRLVNFAVLRALGSTPRQLRGMLVWEQVIIYIAGLGLGVVLGWVLSLTALPLVIFVELATGGNFQNVPNVPPARVVVPGITLAAALGVLIIICVLALILTMGALARLSLGQTLRLNED